MPDLRGDNFKDAEEVLKGMGLDLHIEKTDVESEAEKETVVDTDEHPRDPDVCGLVGGEQDVRRPAPDGGLQHAEDLRRKAVGRDDITVDRERGQSIHERLQSAHVLVHIESHCSNRA